MCHVFITISNGQPEDRKGYVAVKNTIQTSTTRFPFEAGSLPSEMDTATAEATVIFHGSEILPHIPMLDNSEQITQR